MLFDLPEFPARIYRQFTNSFVKDSMMNSKELFGRKCVELATNLKVHAMNTPCRDILLILEHGGVNDVQYIDSVISAELPSEQQDP